MLLRCALIMCVLAIVPYPGRAFAETKNSMSDLIDSSEVIKTYVSDIKNSSGDDNVDLEDLKARLEKALAERMPRKFDFSQKTERRKFEIVKTPAAADVVLNSVIIEYLWTDEDPVDMITGAPGIAYDIMTTENYSRMQVVFSVNDTRSGVLLWEDKISADLTDKKMTEEESYDRINERIVRIFMRELFEKPERNM